MRPIEYTVIDIETIPNINMIDRLPEPEVKFGNTKDPEKIKIKKDQAKEEQIKKMALNPMYGRIASVVMKTGDLVKYMIDDVNDDKKEAEIIKFIACHISPGNKIATWNGINFDVPYIYKRALILGVRMPVPMAYWMKKYSTVPHCDLMQVWCNWFGYTKLDDVAEVILRDKKVDFDVTTIIDLIKTGEGREKVIEYNIKDVELTQQIMYKMGGVLI